MSDTATEGGRPTSPATAPRAVLVVGSARSGAGDLARALQLLGLRVPGSTAAAPTDAASPTGSEAPWVTDFHARLLDRVNVASADARPQAWFETGKLATHEEVRQELFDWLGVAAREAPSDMVIADPRLAWFLSLWKAAGLRCQVEVSHAVTLRAPGEAIGGSARPGPGTANETNRAAGWLNLALHSERATRGSLRTFVPYADLLEDWTVPLYRLGERFGLASLHNATAREIRRVHDLFDSRPAGAGTAWSDVDVPKPLRTLVDETWDQLTKLARADDEPADVHTTLDELRREYAQLYADAERVAHSTIVAARRRHKPRRAGDPARASAMPPETQPRRRLLPRRPKT